MKLIQSEYSSTLVNLFEESLYSDCNVLEFILLNLELSKLNPTSTSSDLFLPLLISIVQIWDLVTLWKTLCAESRWLLLMILEQITEYNFSSLSIPLEFSINITRMSCNILNLIKHIYCYDAERHSQSITQEQDFGPSLENLLENLFVNVGEEILLELVVFCFKGCDMLRVIVDKTRQKLCHSFSQEAAISKKASRKSVMEENLEEDRSKQSKNGIDEWNMDLGDLFPL